jgi:hypothetical protein
MTIQTFESFGKSEFYQRITYQEYSDMCQTKYEPIKNHELNRIKSVFEWKNFKVKKSISTEINYLVGGGYEQIKKEVITILSNPFNKIMNWDIKILKLEDEWWIVIVDSESGTRGPKDAYNRSVSTSDFFKCDQMEGLIKFLQDKIINFQIDIFSTKVSKSQDMWHSIGESINNKKDFYTQVPIVEFDRMTNALGNQAYRRPEIAVDFTPNEHKKLSEIFEESIYRGKIDGFTFPKKYPYIVRVDENFGPKSFDLTIWKVEDYYFWVRYVPSNRLKESPVDGLPSEKTGFVCDQFEGLLELLKDLGLPE